FAFAGVPAEPQLFRPRSQLGYGPVIVGARLAALLSDRLGTSRSDRIRDACGFFFAVSVVSKFFVELRILQPVGSRRGHQRPLPPVTGTIAPETYEASADARKT